MVIEEPEDPLHFPVLKLALEAAAPTTIGQFYDKIKKQIQEQGNKIFTGDPKRQLTTGFGLLQTIHVHDVDSAIAAINLIVEQGEGTKKSPLDPEGTPAHYYRFAEIYYGKMLIPNPEPKPKGPDYAYGGHNISFDACRVWPVITNPKA